MAFQVTLGESQVGIPVAGPLGIALLIALVALAGAFLVRRAW